MADEMNLLMAEMAVQMGFASREQVNECLPDAGSSPLTRVLLERGIINEAQVNLIDQLSAKEPAAPPPSEEKADFDRLVEIKMLAQAGEVEKIMAILREMQGESRFARLGQILLKKSLLNAEQMHALLEEKGIKVMRCETCERNLEVKDYDASRNYRCGACKTGLTAIDLSEIPIPDADMDVVVEEG